MYKTLSVTLNELRIEFLDRSIWIQLVIMPCVLIFFIGLANGGFNTGPADPRVRVDVFDSDGSAVSAQLLAELRAINPNLVLCPADNDADDYCKLDGASLAADHAAARIEAGVTQAAIFIPRGFGEQALSGQPAQLVYQSDTAPGQASPALQALQAAAQRVGGAAVAARVGAEAAAGSDIGADPAFRQAVYDRAAALLAGMPPAVSYSVGGAAGGNTLSGFSQSVPGIGSMYVMFAVLAGVIGFVRARSNWTFQRLMMMPVRPAQIVAGKMLARFVMGLIMYAVAFGFGLLLGTSYGSAPLALLLVMAAFTLCCTAITLLLATIVRTEQQAGVALNLIALIAAPLGGAWWPLEIVPPWMATVGHISPIAWAMNGFNAVIVSGGGLQDVLLPVGVLLAFTVVIFAVAARRFRYD